MIRTRYAEVAPRAEFRYLGHQLEKLTDYCAMDRTSRRYWSLHPGDLVEIDTVQATLLPDASDRGPGFYGWVNDDSD